MDKSTPDPPRSQHWATLIYPESELPHWRQTLSDTLIEAYVSPLHDRDFNADGTPKKPHYHVLMLFESKKSYAQVLQIVKELGGVGAQRVDSKTKMAQYLIHRNNPEKAQYDAADVQVFGGGDYEQFLVADVDRMKALKEMVRFVRENGMVSFADVVDYAERERPDWFKVLAASPNFLQEYIKSFTWGMSNGNK